MGVKLHLLHYEKSRLRVFENRDLRRICGPKWDEITGKWKKLHIEEIHNLYYLQITLGRSNQGE
jgi:hypothetical protein